MGMAGRMMLGGIGEDARGYDHQIARRLLSYLRPHRRRVAGMLVLVVIAMGASNAGPLLLKIGIDDGIMKGDAGLLAVVGIVYLGTLGLMWGLSYFQVVMTAAVGQASLWQLRNDMFAKLQKLSISYFGRNPLGAVMSRITNDVDVKRICDDWCHDARWRCGHAPNHCGHDVRSGLAAVAH